MAPRSRYGTGAVPRRVAERGGAVRPAPAAAAMAAAASPVGRIGSRVELSVGQIFTVQEVGFFTRESLGSSVEPPSCA